MDDIVAGGIETDGDGDANAVCCGDDIALLAFHYRR
jgi:hypothetical protein